MGRGSNADGQGQYAIGRELLYGRAVAKAGRFVLGIVLYLQYLSVLGLPNIYYGYCYFPNTIQYNIESED